MIVKLQPRTRRISALCALLAAGLVQLGRSPDAVAQPAPDEPDGPDRVEEEPKPAPSPEPEVEPVEPPAPKPRPKPKGGLSFDPRDPRIDEDMLEAITEAEGGELTRDIIAEVLSPKPDGLTPDQVADQAVDTSPSVETNKKQILEASARVDQAFAAYFPRVTLGASYTRVNKVNLTLNIPGAPSGGSGPSFPQALNQWALTASLEVPISDYIFRLTQAYAAASKDVESKELQTEAERIQVRAEAKAAYFNWIRAQGRAVVSGMAVALSRRHLDDAQASFAAGTIAGADVARLESQVAQSRHLLNSSLALERVLAMRLKRVMHIPNDAPLAIGVDVMVDPPPKQKRPLPDLITLAETKRLDIKALKRSKETLEELESTARAGYAPRISAFANGLYANPNPRVFTAGAQWNFTWELGARVTWTINDSFQTIGAVSEAEAKTAQVTEQLRALEDGIVMAVTQAYYDIDTARSAIEAADKREEAASKSLDARRKLFRGGRATATEIVDAEAELIEARLQRVDAHVDLLVARANLEAAVGARLY